KLKENAPILAINVLDRAHSRAPIVKQLGNEFQEAHFYDQVLEQKLHSLQDELTHTREEMSRLLAEISSQCYETHLQSFDNRLRVMEDKGCEPYPFELDASDVETSVDIVEARIQYLGLSKRERQEYREFEAVIEERDKYKKEAEDIWQIVKGLKEKLMDKIEQVEYLQGRQLYYANQEAQG
ncbi:2884_t:CDS:1, partial [Paraglomus brasilianum]